MMATLSRCNRSRYWISGSDWSLRPDASSNAEPPPHLTDVHTYYWISASCLFREHASTFLSGGGLFLVNLQFPRRCWPASLLPTMYLLVQPFEAHRKIYVKNQSKFSSPSYKDHSSPTRADFPAFRFVLVQSEESQPPRLTSAIIL